MRCSSCVHLAALQYGQAQQWSWIILIGRIFDARPTTRRSRSEHAERADPYSLGVLAGVLGDGGHDLVGCLAA